MWTYEATRAVDANPEAVATAIAAVIERLWGGRARLVVDSTAAGRVDAVDDDVWLTWRVERAGSGTRVQVMLDELDHGPDPTEALEHIVDLVEQAIDAAIRRNV